MEALTIEEKWKQITDEGKEFYNYEGSDVLVSSDANSLTFTSEGNFECKYTFENGIISFSKKDSVCDVITTEIIYSVADIFGYSSRPFIEWFVENYGKLTLEKDGFEVTGVLIRDTSNTSCSDASGMGRVSLFDHFYCNEDSGVMIYESYILNTAKIDLERGFISFDPQTQEGEKDNQVSSKEETVKVQDTLSNNSTILMVVAGITVILGVTVVYSGFVKKGKA